MLRSLVDSERCIRNSFEDMYQVKPGELVVWDYSLKKIIRKENYYTWQVSEELLDTASKTNDAFKTSMKEVIKRQIKADVSLGTFLS